MLGQVSKLGAQRPVWLSLATGDVCRLGQCIYILSGVPILQSLKLPQGLLTVNTGMPQTSVGNFHSPAFLLHLLISMCSILRNDTALEYLLATLFLFTHILVMWLIFLLD